MFSEVRVEGLETLDYFDNLNGKKRFTEQADVITFDDEVFWFAALAFIYLFGKLVFCTSDVWLLTWARMHHAQFESIKAYFEFMTKQVDRVYLCTPTKIAIIDHEKKRTYELRKEGLPDAGGYFITFKWIFFNTWLVSSNIRCWVYFLLLEQCCQRWKRKKIKMYFIPKQRNNGRKWYFYPSIGEVKNLKDKWHSSLVYFVYLARRIQNHGHYSSHATKIIEKGNNRFSVQFYVVFCLLFTLCSNSRSIP